MNLLTLFALFWGGGLFAFEGQGELCSFKCVVFSCLVKNCLFFNSTSCVGYVTATVSEA